MHFLLICMLGLCYRAYFAKSSYLGELAISFLPYLCGLALIGVCLSLRRLGKVMMQKKNKIWLLISSFFILWFWTIFACFMVQIMQFYGEYALAPNEKTNLKVLFSNIYKDNTGYDEITGAIALHKPDLVMFVEFEEHHYEHLIDYLKQNFQHIKYLPWSTSIIASKYPLKFLPTSVTHRLRKYQTFELHKADEIFYGYLVHTSSPTSKKHFHNRNEQLSIIAKDFITLQARSNNEKTFMVWDFNVSPRSAYYQSFSQALSGKMENATKSFSFYFSWNLAKLLQIAEIHDSIPHILFSHIDQLFVSPALKVKSLEGIQFSGSDHRGFLFELH